MTTAATNIFEAAKQELLTRGWNQSGVYIDLDGKVCALGALRVAAGSQVMTLLDGLVYVSEPLDYRYERYEQACDNLARTLTATHGCNNIVYYNDNVATDVQDILDLFDAAAVTFEEYTTTT